MARRKEELLCADNLTWNSMQIIITANRVREIRRVISSWGEAERTKSTRL
jgi:hypothetical protein